MNESNQLTIYCIPGLGVNSHLFKKLKLSACTIRHIKWIDPFKKERLDQYAMRLAEQIDTSSPFVLIGVSFGGMCCIEIAKKLSPLKTFLISSSKTCYEIPIRVRLLAILPIHILIKGDFHMKIVWLLKIIFKITPEVEKDYDDVLSHLPQNYLGRAIQMIVTWKNKTCPNHVVQIQGTEDRVLPFKGNVEYQYTIKNGTHIMVLDHPEEISEILNKELEEINLGFS
ncbi:MAG: alpha/beta hydrolase [Bacteroidia bacterium]